MFMKGGYTRAILVLISRIARRIHASRPRFARGDLRSTKIVPDDFVEPSVVLSTHFSKQKNTAMQCFFVYGEGGIRTHVGAKLPIRFRVGAVMTASVPLPVNFRIIRNLILVSSSFVIASTARAGTRKLID